MSDLQGRLPDIIPMETIRIDGEEITYEVQQDDDGNRIEKTRYVPNKAPFEKIEDLTGIVDGSQYDFTEGVDYEVIDSDGDGRDETIDFSVGGESPDDNTDFEVTYLAKSIILRFVESYEDEFHRLRDDIEEVISSHYVDEATETGYIDDFEDEELVEYEYQAGTDLNATVQSNVAFHGDWSLRMESPVVGGPARIASTSGLPRYPTRGDTIEYYYKFDNADDIGHFDFSYTEAGSVDRYYRVTVDANTNELTLKKEPQSSRTDTESVSLGSYQGDWIQVEISIDPIGQIKADLLDPNDAVIASVSIEDTEYTNGGIRWAAENPNGQSKVYFDALDIIGRRSGDLDRVGAIFGALGKRRGRTDEEYQTFLRSIVQSFSGRGTIDGIKFAVASALDVDPDQIDVTEDFQENSYTITLTQPFPPHELRTLTELADLADPSGVEFGSLSYTIKDEETGVSESLDISTSQPFFEDVFVDDSATVNTNKITEFEDVTISASVTIDGNNITAIETTGIADELVTTEDDINTFLWEQGSWDFMEWTELIDLGTISSSEQIQADDAVTVDANKIVTGPEAVGVDDASTVQTPTSTTDTFRADDTGGVQTPVSNTESVTADDTGGVQAPVSDTESVGTNETAVVSPTLVAWDLGDWNTMSWAKEHN